MMYRYLEQLSSQDNPYLLKQMFVGKGKLRLLQSKIAAVMKQVVKEILTKQEVRGQNLACWIMIRAATKEDAFFVQSTIINISADITFDLKGMQNINGKSAHVL